MRFFLALLAAACAVGASANQLYRPPIGQAIPRQFTLATGVGDAGENLMIKTETTYLAEPTVGTINMGDCHNVCKGGKHAKHADCDLSCDEACPTRTEGKRHAFKQPFTRFEDSNEAFDGPPKVANRIQIGNHFSAMRLPSLVNTNFMAPGASFDFGFRESIGSRGEGAQAVIGENVFLFLEHWNTTPCSKATVTCQTLTYRVRIDYMLFYAKQNPETKVINTVDGPTGTLFMKLTVVDPNTKTLGEPVEECKCEKKQGDAPVEHGYIPGTPLEGYATVETDGKKRIMTGGDVLASIGSIEVPSMNEAIFTPASWLTSTYVFPAGWQLESESGKVQDVQLQDDLIIKPNMAGQRIYVSLRPSRPSLPFLEPITVRTLCLEMDQPEPRKGEKFRLVPPDNPALTKLAQITKGSRFRGPWDQMRLWIATDYATLDQIGKKLIPAPGGETYLRELWNCVQAGAVELESSKLVQMAQPSLLLGGDNVSADAAAWLVQYRMNKSPKDMVAYLRSNAEKLPTPAGSAVLRGGARDRLQGIVGALLASGQSDAVALALEITDKNRRPEKIVWQVAESLPGVTDPAAVGQILTWFEAMPAAEKKNVPVNISPSLPAALQERAANLNYS